MAVRVIIAQEEPSIDVPDEHVGDQELPESFGEKVGVIAIMNFMKKVRYSNTGLNIESIAQLVSNTPEIVQYNLNDSAIDQAITAGGNSRANIRATMFQDLFTKLASSGQYEPSLVSTEGATAAMFLPEPGETGSTGGTAPYDALWQMVGQKFSVVIQQQQNERKKTMAPPPPQIRAMKKAQMAPPPVEQPMAEQQPSQPVQDSPLGNKYEALSDLKDDLIARGPSEQTYNDMFEMVGPDNEDSVREALSSFYQGSATAIGRIYEMLVTVGKANPIDSEVVGEIMGQHPELNPDNKEAKAYEGGCKYAGLFLPPPSTMTKLAESAAFPHYPPAGAALRMCPKTRDLVPLEICRYHCLDGLVVDDTQVLCGEAIWRQNVMDKFSTEYRDKDGNYVGGYLNKRFKTEHDDGGHPALLKPGQRSAPIHEDAWSTEKRLQELRKSESSDRNYSKTPGDPKDVYTFDQHKEDKGPKNPQAFEKKPDPESKTAAVFNLRQQRLANPVIDPANEDMSPKATICPKCNKTCAKDAVVCDVCQCPLKGNPNAQQMNSAQMQGQSGALGHPAQIMAGVEVHHDLGIFKASARGQWAYATTAEEAIEKLANSLADLEQGTIGNQNDELNSLMSSETQAQDHIGLPGQPEANPHGDQPPDAARIDMTPSTPGIESIENQNVEVQDGRSMFEGNPSTDSGEPAQPTEPAQEISAPEETGMALVGKTFPIDSGETDAGNLDAHLEEEGRGLHPDIRREIHDQAFNSGAGPIQ